MVTMGEYNTLTTGGWGRLINNSIKSCLQKESKINEVKSNLNPFLMAYKFWLPRTVLFKKKIKRTEISLNLSLSFFHYQCHDKKVFTTLQPITFYVSFLWNFRNKAWVTVAFHDCSYVGFSMSVFGCHVFCSGMKRDTLSHTRQSSMCPLWLSSGFIKDLITFGPIIP